MSSLSEASSVVRPSGKGPGHPLVHVLYRDMQPVAGRPSRSERGEVILKAKRQRGLPVGQRLQAAALAQQRRVMAAVDNSKLAAGADLRQRRG